MRSRLKANLVGVGVDLGVGPPLLDPGLGRVRQGPARRRGDVAEQVVVELPVDHVVVGRAQKGGEKFVGQSGGVLGHGRGEGLHGNRPSAAGVKLPKELSFSKSFSFYFSVGSRICRCDSSIVLHTRCLGPLYSLITR